MPRSQIDTARLDEATGMINVAGPFDDDGRPIAPLLIHVTLIQDMLHAHGVGTDTRLGGVSQGRWSARAEAVGAFKVGEFVDAFGIVVMVAADQAGPRLHYETFTWSERVKLEKQL